MDFAERRSDWIPSSSSDYLRVLNKYLWQWRPIQCGSNLREERQMKAILLDEWVPLNLLSNQSAFKVFNIESPLPPLHGFEGVVNHIDSFLFKHVSTK